MVKTLEGAQYMPIDAPRGGGPACAAGVSVYLGVLANCLDVAEIGLRNPHHLYYPWTRRGRVAKTLPVESKSSHSRPLAIQPSKGPPGPFRAFLAS